MQKHNKMLLLLLREQMLQSNPPHPVVMPPLQMLPQLPGTHTCSQCYCQTPVHGLHTLFTIDKAIASIVYQIHSHPHYSRIPPHSATAWVDPSTLPSHWSEVFIGNIAKTATEQDVRAFCEPVGPVHSLHLIPDPANPGQNKGFGFVRFATKKAAATALETLSGKELGAYPGRRLRVSPSQSKHKLYLGNIPRDAVRDDLQERLQQAAPGKGLIV